MAAKKAPAKKAPAKKSGGNSGSANAAEKRSQDKKNKNNTTRVTSNIPSNRSTEKAWAASEPKGVAAAGKVLSKRASASFTGVGRSGKTDSFSSYKSFAAKEAALKEANSAQYKAQQKEMMKRLRKKK